MESLSKLPLNLFFDNFNTYRRHPRYTHPYLSLSPSYGCQPHSSLKSCPSIHVFVIFCLLVWWFINFNQGGLCDLGIGIFIEVCCTHQCQHNGKQWLTILPWKSLVASNSLGRQDLGNPSVEFACTNGSLK